jgi:DNA mismatch endonuclease (patch repair protein)
MADIVDRLTRSRMMAAVRTKNTKPEILVRRALHRAGLRFRLHVKELPGTPDIVLPRHRTVLLIQGCYWHGHGRCKKGTLPASNRGFWTAKINENRRRDRRTSRALRAQGWRVVMLWECEIRKAKRIGDVIATIRKGKTSSAAT